MATTRELTYSRGDGHELPGPPEPPNPFESVIRHPLLALLPILLLVGAAVAVGHYRKPTWTSDARLSVGELSPSTQSAPGIVEANQQLASAYSRAINANAVLTPVSKRLGLRNPEVNKRLSASPIPDSPIILVSAKAPTERGAIATAEAGTLSLVRYVRALGNRDTAGERILRKLNKAQAKVHAQELRGIQSDASTLRVKALKQQYLENTQRTGATPITVLNPAEAATNDRTKVLRLAIVIGALAGIAVGVALAVAREVRVRRRNALEQGG
jgi:capsular polysaccharide biosynthesis protein